MNHDYVERNAIFSDCRTWRYHLWRIWDPALPPMAAGMLNPSRANEDRPDKTVSNQINRAAKLGYGSLHVFNAFAFVTPYPKIMKDHLGNGFDVVGPETNTHIRSILIDVRDRGGLVTVGWGNDGTLAGRDVFIADLAAELGIILHSLGTTKSGQPRHPRGVPSNQAYVPWRPRAAIELPPIPATYRPARTT